MTIAELVPGESVTQFAVLDALLAGAYESGISVADVGALGDFGLGCCDHLGGEVVILNGDAFECTSDGLVSRMRSEEILPFAVVCRFGGVEPQSIADADLTTFAERIEGALVSRNLFHAVRVDGLFASVRVRVTPRQHHPFRPLAVVTSEQIETVIPDARGTLVASGRPRSIRASRSPDCICTSSPTTAAAAVTSSTSPSGSAELRIAAYAGLDLRLPTDEMFLRTELTHDEDHRIVAVEGAAAG